MSDDGMRKRTLDQLMQDEEFRSKPYVDTVGKLTIGYGRNLTDKGLSEPEARYLLFVDFQAALNWCIFNIPHWDDLSGPRQSVFVNMTFNLGLGWIRKWPRLTSALLDRNFNQVAAEMENSKWFHQVGSRALRLVWMMRNNSYPKEKKNI